MTTISHETFHTARPVRCVGVGWLSWSSTVSLIDPKNKMPFYFDFRENITKEREQELSKKRNEKKNIRAMYVWLMV